MSNDIFLWATAMWFLGAMLFVLYCLLDTRGLEVDEGLVPDWQTHILLDDEWLYFASPAYPPYMRLQWQTE